MSAATVDKLKQINADTWRAAAVEAYRRAGEAVCLGRYDEAVEWQEKASSYSRRGYVKDSAPATTGL